MLNLSLCGALILIICHAFAATSQAQNAVASPLHSSDVASGSHDSAFPLNPDPVADPPVIGPPAADGSSLPNSSVVPPLLDAAAFEPVVKTETPPPAKINWTGLTKDSMAFIAVMQMFRLSTEQGTRDAFANPFFAGWFNAVGNMHGFADGDPFTVNYVGHPMQGAVSGFIWSYNDRAYKNVHYGRNKQYWKEKLRAGAFSYVYSVQFEVGPVSEASLGDIQAYYPARGFVDHVVTPALGMGWAIGEDVIDQYLIRSIEAHTTNRYVRMLTRSGLNPARSFANLMGFRRPWTRTNRAAPSDYNSADYYEAPVEQNPSPPPGVAPFEFHTESAIRTYFGGNSLGSCIGGGAGVGFRLASEWQLVADVNGCKMTSLPTNVSGDSLTYVIGPRWSSQRSPRWITHAKFLLGGTKVTQEYIDPEKKRLSDIANKDKNIWPPPYSDFAKSWDNNAFALVTGAGVDLKFNNALSLRTALDYSHTWNHNLNDINYRNSLQLTSGLVLNMGTW
jgi:hypothetical protein